MSRTIRIVVVLPAPFAPRNPYIWPSGTSNEIPSSAVTGPNRLTSLSRTSAMAPSMLAAPAQTDQVPIGPKRRVRFREPRHAVGGLPAAHPKAGRAAPLLLFPA